MDPRILAQDESVTSLALSPIAYGAIAFGALIVLLLITIGFRNVSNRR